MEMKGGSVTGTEGTQRCWPAFLEGLWAGEAFSTAFK